MSRSWTACLKIRHSGSLIDLTKYERACTQSCNKRLGSNLVWGMSQDQTVCLELGQPVCKLDILSHWLSWQNMRELACNLVMGFLAVNLCEVWLNIRQNVSKLNSKSDILAHWLSWQNMRELAGNLVTGVLAVIVCEVCLKIRQYVLKLDSLSQSWTICSLVFLTKDERACMQSCYGRLGSDLVWSMPQDQTLCLEVGRPVSKLDDLLIGILDKRWESMHAILLRASWEWSCVECISRLNSMSRSWTTCLKVRHSGSLIVLRQDWTQFYSSNKLTCTLVFSHS